MGKISKNITTSKSSKSSMITKSSKSSKSSTISKAARAARPAGAARTSKGARAARTSTSARAARAAGAARAARAVRAAARTVRGRGRRYRHRNGRPLLFFFIVQGPRAQPSPQRETRPPPRAQPSPQRDTPPSPPLSQQHVRLQWKLQGGRQQRAADHMHSVVKRVFGAKVSSEENR